MFALVAGRIIYKMKLKDSNAGKGRTVGFNIVVW